jgi:hypothetical protein
VRVSATVMAVVEEWEGVREGSKAGGTSCFKRDK